jgi:5-(carboxyamino)imidazole ribonucleotide mutase
MRVFVVFGSKSDETVSGPLVAALSRDFEVEYEVISAHRDLEKLQEKIHGWRGDAIVAGAGLAAALPGVVAAMTDLPVFGVPVPAQFGGLDSLCSIAQMPPGVPVMSCGPASSDAVVSFLRSYKIWTKVAAVHFISSLSHPDLLPELEKAKMLGKEKGIAVTFSAEEKAGAFPVVIVTKPEDVRKEEFCLHVPFLPKAEIQKPSSYLALMDWANLGGLWVGANNTRNAVHSVLRLVK